MIVYGYAAQKDNSTRNVKRDVLFSGSTTSFDVAWYADISLNIQLAPPYWSFFFKGLYYGSSNGAVLVGYYNYFNSTPLLAGREKQPIQLRP